MGVSIASLKMMGITYGDNFAFAMLA